MLISVVFAKLNVCKFPMNCFSSNIGKMTGIGN